MRFTLPSRRPVMPRPRPPLPPAEPIDVPGELPQPASRLPWRSPRWARPFTPPILVGARWSDRRRGLTGIAAAGAAMVLLCFGVGWVTNADQVRLGRGSGAVSTGWTATGQAEKAADDRATARQAADDKAAAAKVLAAKVADARAAAARRAADRARAREEVAMPALVGLGVAGALDVAARAGLTDVSVCRPPAGEAPARRSEWRVTGQDVAAGTRISADRRVCLTVTGRQLIKDSVR
ncbi:PASTA domain-containing protein [Actinoplanes sp. NPDC048967]|uniref:PASTA domain-containing protein n=1 Tax=Actinoplanes sp. NPDC048967 TaxID=3155269 RepID=UPI003408EBE3